MVLWSGEKMGAKRAAAVFKKPSTKPARAGAKSEAAARVVAVVAVSGAATQAAWEEGAEEERGAKPKGLAKASALRKKVLEELGDRSMEEVLELHKRALRQTEAAVAEDAALRAAQDRQVEKLQAEFVEASAEVSAAMEREREAVTTHLGIKQRREEMESGAAEMRRKLLKAQKRLTLLELDALKARRGKELQDPRARAAAAEAAKKTHLAQKQRQSGEAAEAAQVALGGAFGTVAASGAGQQAAGAASTASAAAAEVATNGLGLDRV